MTPEDFFPYKFRFNQRKAMWKIYDLVRAQRNVFFHAPTGYGKTIVVLSALLPIALEEDLHIIWAVRTGNETDRPIEELRVINEHTGEEIYGISIRGKRDMCLLARERGISDSEGVSVLCEKMKSKCRYFEGLKYMRDLPEEPLTFSQLLEDAKKRKYCPYYYQLRTTPYATLISVNYNYVFSPTIQWALRAYIDFRDSILVVDEAHNLQHVITRINSDRITITTVDRAIGELMEVPHKSSRLLLPKIRKLKEILIEEGRKILAEDDIFDPAEILEKSGIDENDFSEAHKIVEKIYAIKIAQKKSPRSSLRHLIEFFERALENQKKRGVVFIKSKEKEKFVFEMIDFRAAEVLRRIWRRFYAKVFMSGTLKPYQAFADIVGIKKYSSVSGIFPIPKQNVLALVIRGLTTRGEELSEDMARAYIQALRTLIPITNGNSAVFFASYRIMNELLDNLLEQLKNSGKTLLVEYEGMRGDEAKKLVDLLKTNRDIVLLANIAGRFAEGVDLPGEALQNIFIVGIPFERLTIKTTLYIEYYKEIYGQEKGVFYSYVLPALRKASQAMGRAIRSPTDRAVIVAMDERYSESRFLDLLPEFFSKNYKKVSVEEAKIEISKFWSAQKKLGKQNLYYPHNESR